MTHPITPPPELMQAWAAFVEKYGIADVFTTAAQWGADQELEACCEWLLIENSQPCSSGVMRAARRPKLPSLKEQALAALDNAVLRGDCITVSDALPTIRKALEALDD
jgi:hypothetical protein